MATQHFRGINYTNQVFGRLSVISNSGRSQHGENLWKCRCTCGAIVEAILGSSLRRGKTKSCGCLMREEGSKRQHKHGMYGTSTYRSWAMMVQRTTNKNLPDWKDYGGRGITLYEPWKDFSIFLKDMGEKPTESHSIERKNNNKGYSPDNCKWATDGEQRRNKRINHNLTLDGRTMCIEDWSTELNISSNTLRSRLTRGWSTEKTLKTPLMRK